MPLRRNGYIADMSGGGLAIAIGLAGIAASFVMIRLQRTARSRASYPPSTMAPGRRKQLMIAGLVGFVLWLSAAAAIGVATHVAGQGLTSGFAGAMIGSILWWAFFMGLAAILRRRSR